MDTESVAIGAKKAGLWLQKMETLVFYQGVGNPLPASSSAHDFTHA